MLNQRNSLHEQYDTGDLTWDEYSQKLDDLYSTSECCEGEWCDGTYWKGLDELKYDGDKCAYLDTLTWAMLVPIILNTAFTAYYW